MAGASSYSVYHGGIEIQIATQKAYRRRGLATACGAKLILLCLERGLNPSWDAHDLRSVALAEKLGYRRGSPMWSIFDGILKPVKPVGGEKIEAASTWRLPRFLLAPEQAFPPGMVCFRRA